MKYSKRKEAKIRKRKFLKFHEIIWLQKVDEFRFRQRERAKIIVHMCVTAAIGAFEVAKIQSTVGMTREQKAIAIAQQVIHTAEHLL